jgi:hypothetical protein
MARTKVKKRADAPAVPPRPVPVAAPAPHAPAVAEGTDAEEKMTTARGKNGELHCCLPRPWRVVARCGEALFQSSSPFFSLPFCVFELMARRLFSQRACWGKRL